MKILLSPAKLMDLKTNLSIEKSTTPLFIDKTQKIQDKFKKLSPLQIKDLMNISDKLAQENWERNQIWSPRPSVEESIQAFLAFKGEVFRGLNTESISVEKYNYVENSLFILSGLYGILRPFDRIMPYRMEMGIDFSKGKNKNLYQFWSKIITEYLNYNIDSEDFILNLASKEYVKVVDRKILKNKIIDIEFKENRNGKLMNIMTYFKNARGKMARYCIDNEIHTVEDVKKFTIDNYSFSQALSTENNFVFIR